VLITICNKREEEKNTRYHFCKKMAVRRNIGAAELTALIKVEHMVENNKYGQRQSKHCPPSPSLDAQLLPRACGISFHQILQLGPLTLSRTFYYTAFGQRHNLQQFLSHSQTQVPPVKEEGRLGARTSGIHSILLSSQRWRERSHFAQSGTVRFVF